MVLDYNKVYLLLGSNMGARLQLLEDAIKNINLQIGEVVEKSSMYETAAWGKTDQPGFLNIAIAVNTLLSPIEVLTKALEIETKLGRIREEKWGARLIDIDIIFYGNDIVNIPDQLQIPHPEMHKRKFVLEPLVEIDPDLQHPLLKMSISALLLELNDQLEVTRI
ncbi:MAG: 2-amino-4-hydroxy-6-hydroxymethyldihydropteridine diphosphokinase [Sphingobacteriales bacterium]|nr:MAG: 2-amino-4-hydroxy-6-hydroxymethyldihydropteridine diphosphokinase [Sphingobacteriales bacterium]